MLARGQARIVKERHYEESLKALLQCSFKIAPSLSKESPLALERKLCALFDLLQDTSFEKEKEKYRAFLQSFRSVLKDPDYQQALLLQADTRLMKCLEHIHQLAFSFFAKIDLQDFSKGLIKELVGVINCQSFDTLFEQLKVFHQKLHKSLIPWREKGFLFYLFYVKDQINFGFDPFLQGNLPFFFFSTKYQTPSGRPKEVANLRFACPSIEDFSAAIFHQAQLSPEFKAFLAFYQRNGKKHLYVNLQDRTLKFFWKNEAARCLALEELMKREPKELVYIGLSKNCAFYWQDQEYENFNQSSSFKQKLLEKVLIGKHFFLPLSFREDPKFQQDLEKLMEKIHQALFDEKYLLTKPERLDFIEIFYAYLIEYLIEKTQVDSYNITCKDGIDRGVGMSTLIYLLQLLRKGSQKLDGQDLAALVFVPAMLARLREIQAKRLERMLSAFVRLFEAKKKKISLELFEQSHKIYELSRRA